MTRHDLMDLIPYLIMGFGLTIIILELSKVYQ
jgi:hypothetical protein